MFHVEPPADLLLLLPIANAISPNLPPFIMTTHQLSPYEQLRVARIKRNEERLASLGLLDAKKTLRRASTPTRRGQPSTPRGRNIRPKRHSISSIAAVTPSPVRSSRRLTHKPVQYQPLLDDNDDVTLRIARKKFTEIQKKTTTKTLPISSGKKIKLNVHMDVSSAPLSKEEKGMIMKKVDGDFLGKFEVRKSQHGV